MKTRSKEIAKVIDILDDLCKEDGLNSFFLLSRIQKRKQIMV